MPALRVAVMVYFFVGSITGDAGRAYFDAKVELFCVIGSYESEECHVGDGVFLFVVHRTGFGAVFFGHIQGEDGLPLGIGFGWQEVSVIVSACLYEEQAYRESDEIEEAVILFHNVMFYLLIFFGTSHRHGICPEERVICVNTVPWTAQSGSQSRIIMGGGSTIIQEVAFLVSCA